MLILAFNTANNSTSVCLARDKEILQKITINEAGQQSEKLILIFEEILKNNQIWYQDLDLIAYANGSGSFTGLRIALITAKILNLTTKIPVIAVDVKDSIEADFVANMAYEEYKKNPDIINDSRNYQAIYSSEPKITKRKN